jgi:cytidylate kinase
MYRVVTYAALQLHADLTSEAVLDGLVSGLSICLPPDKVLLNGEDVTRAIRTVEVTRASRFVADSPSVRRRLVEWQRAFAESSDTVTEGRDQGTIVFPDAFRKFFLTASAEERARRRLADLLARDETATLESVLADQTARDARDEARAIAPMKPAADAIVFDSSGLNIDEVVARLERLTLNA